MTGQAIVGYVILRRAASEALAKQTADDSSQHLTASEIANFKELGEELRQHVAAKLGPIARPKRVVLVPDLPKTRSGKIMRRLLRDVVEGRDLGDTTTLADAGVVEEIRSRAVEEEDE